MTDLSDSLSKLNAEHKLLVARGSPEVVLPILWKNWGITDMYFEKARSVCFPYFLACSQLTTNPYTGSQDTAAYGAELGYI